MTPSQILALVLYFVACFCIGYTGADLWRRYRQGRRVAHWIDELKADVENLSNHPWMKRQAD